MKPLHVREGGGFDGRPHCLNCRRVMRSDGADARSGRPRWKCPRCGVSCAKHTRPMREGPRAHLRPCCVACRREMWRRCGESYFRCGGCGVTVRSARVNRKPPGRPAFRDRPAAVAALLAQIAAALPGYLAPDERDDAAQAVMLEVLSGRLPKRVPAPLTLRRYAAEARGMASDRYHFISLSQPMRDGREFGETLAA